ncbi:glycosyltransferase [uncultured Subdoligranulum sp.]|uniref:glycosyltransferase n=1 Tax=uncultured Subdoligranulum sp. TaxID=512298 RepID=UPI0026329947|nr:glycosyltransferase [uncultured Subdoligranulum sp.]
MEKILTVLVAQYRPDAAALRRTLASLVLQDTRDFAVVLADDGSPQNYFAESTAYLAAHGITGVQAAAMPQNGGTVCNILHALQKVTTRWVLTISPGDYLYDAGTVRWWLERLQADAPRVAFARQAYYTAQPDPAPVPGETPFDRSPYDPTRYDGAAIKRNLLLYDDGISGCGMVYERDLLTEALQTMAGQVRLAEDFSLRLFAVQGVRIQRYDRLTSWYEYGGGVSTNETARQRMAAEWRAMVELLHRQYPKDRTVRLAYAYFFNDRHKSRLVRGLVGRLIVPQNAPFKKAQRAWQPPNNGDAALLRRIYDTAVQP